MPGKKGLPKIIKMRHDAHYIDELSSRLGAPLGRMIKISIVEPNPNQPRSSAGDLTELKASIRQKGILEPILVRFIKGRYQIISGERRFTAAKEIGLEEIPCIIIQASDKESLEISLIENLQREDLSPFEEADGLYSLYKRFNYTHDEIADKIGKSRSTITESLSLANIPPNIRDLCQDTGIKSKSILIQIARQKNDEDMTKLIESISRKGLTRNGIRSISSSKSSKLRKQSYVFKYSPKDRNFSLIVKFKNPQISQQEIISSLEKTIYFIKENIN